MSGVGYQLSGLDPKPDQEFRGSVEETSRSPTNSEPQLLLWEFMASLNRLSAKGSGEGGTAGEELVVEFWDQCRGFVFKLFRGQGFSHSRAEDLVQEVFVRVLRRKDELGDIESPAAWVKSIAMGVWKNYLRDCNAAKRGPKELSLDQQLEEAGEVFPADMPVGTPRSHSPEEQTLARDEIRAAREDISRLPPQQRRCLRFFLGQDLSYQEISQVMGISVNAVKSHVSQGRQRLRYLREARGRT